jgi:hypothetical protein
LRKSLSPLLVFLAKRTIDFQNQKKNSEVANDISANRNKARDNRRRRKLLSRAG